MSMQTGQKRPRLGAWVIGEEQFHQEETLATHGTLGAWARDEVGVDGKPLDVAATNPLAAHAVQQPPAATEPTDVPPVPPTVTEPVVNFDLATGQPLQPSSATDIGDDVDPELQGEAPAEELKKPARPRRVVKPEPAPTDAEGAE